ncbi:hypothetical protein ANCCAN_23845 [Ancylostoma caninum]|uniref:Uncharacterized protein n=1 Tax=Ancylostoma caninum TaxID=29170 RepID=A0A368FJP9_ANCCA|nr:hypothetical protein ANCCAN_23845 [Ancylostoma caninum]
MPSPTRERRRRRSRSRHRSRRTGRRSRSSLKSILKTKYDSSCVCPCKQWKADLELLAYSERSDRSLADTASIHRRRRRKKSVNLR